MGEVIRCAMLVGGPLDGYVVEARRDWTTLWMQARGASQIMYLYQRHGQYVFEYVDREEDKRAVDFLLYDVSRIGGER